MSVTKELVRNVRRRVAEDPGVLTGQLARELRASEEEVVMALPVAMRKKARAGGFASIWERMASWGNVILYSSCFADGLDDGLEGGRDGGADRVQGPMLSYGALCNREVSARGRAFFEQTGREVASRIGTVWFVSMPMFGGRSASVRLYGKAGEHILSVYLGRDRSGDLDAAAVADFEALREEYGVTPVPRNCCKGKGKICQGNCACANRMNTHKGPHAHGERVT